MKKHILHYSNIIYFIMAALIIFLAVPAYSKADVYSRVIDNSDLLSSSEAEQLNTKILSITSAYQFDIVIVTTDSTSGLSMEAYADDFYDYGGYGYGTDNDGMIFVLNMAEREYYTSTSGIAINYFSDDLLDGLHDSCVKYLSSGDYYTAFSTYLDNVEKVLKNPPKYTVDPDSGSIDSTFSDDYYDFYNDYVNVDVNPFSAATSILPLFFIISAIVTLVVLSTFKRQLNTLVSSGAANCYVKDNSLNFTVNTDTYLRSTTSRRIIQTSTTSGSSGGSSSHHSSTHTSSSGHSHGGGGGHF